jgi:mono/diheme cytochrome c family protein/thiol-disulfide isomerase/thioredoxin
MNHSTRPDDRDDPVMPRPSQRPRAVQVLGIALTVVFALMASAALAWSLRTWRERPGTSPVALASATVPAPSTATTDRDAVLLSAGRLAFQVHCTRCHGAEGHGDGPDAERLQPPPRDFASEHWRFGPTPESVRRVIVAGIPGTAMPGWGDSLSRRELDGLVAHVLSLAPMADTHGRGSDEPLPSALLELLERAGFVAEATPRLAPPLELCDLDGNATTLDDRRGRSVLVLFWGTTCGPCLAELSAIHRLADRGLDVLPVCIDEPDPAVVRDVVGPQLSGRSLYLDLHGKARLRYDVQALPTFILIDPSGRLIARAQGARDWTVSALDDLVRQGLAPAAIHNPSRGVSLNAARGNP